MAQSIRGRIGFIGLGHMGGPVARHVVASGAEVVVHDVKSEAVAALVDAGARCASSPAQVMEDCDIVAVCVVDDDQVREVLAGPAGLLTVARDGQYVVVHSTIAPTTIIELAAQAWKSGVAIVDAPVSGNIEERSSGQLTVFVGGSDEAVEAVWHYLSMIGMNVEHLGGIGAGLIGKLCNNLMLFCNTLGAFEAVAVAAEFGIDEDVIVRMAAQGTGGSWVLDNWGWFDKLLIEHPIGDVAAVIDFLQRDLNYVTETASAQGRRLQIGAQVAELLRPMFLERHKRAHGSFAADDDEERKE